MSGCNDRCHSKFQNRTKTGTTYNSLSGWLDGCPPPGARDPALGRVPLVLVQGAGIRGATGGRKGMADVSTVEVPVVRLDPGVSGEDIHGKKSYFTLKGMVGHEQQRRLRAARAGGYAKRELAKGGGVTVAMPKGRPMSEESKEKLRRSMRAAHARRRDGEASVAPAKEPAGARVVSGPAARELLIQELEAEVSSLQHAIEILRRRLA
jgi:hypothetical protein